MIRFAFRIINFFLGVLASIVHIRSNYLASSIADSFQRFEFTFQTSVPKIKGSLNYAVRSFKTSLIFWACMAVSVVLVAAVSLRSPLEQKFENKIQGYYIQNYDMDLKTLFGQAPDFIAVTADGQSQQVFGVDANTCIVSRNGKQLSLDDLVPGMPLFISWNGSADAPDALVIEVPYTGS